MPISRPWASNSGPPELPGLIEASVWRQSVYSSSVPAGILVAVHAGDDPVGDRGLEIGGQQERVAHGEAPSRRPATLVAVGQLGVREIVAAEELDQGHVARGIEAHDHGVVDPAVGHAALHRVAAGLGDVEVGQGVAVGRDHHARAAARRRSGEKTASTASFALAITATRSASALSTAGSTWPPGPRAPQAGPTRQRQSMPRIRSRLIIRPSHCRRGSSFDHPRVAQSRWSPTSRSAAEIDQDRQPPHAGQVEARSAAGGSVPVTRHSQSTRSSPRITSRTLPSGRTRRRCRPRPRSGGNARQAIDHLGAAVHRQALGYFLPPSCSGPAPGCGPRAGRRTRARRQLLVGGRKTASSRPTRASGR